MKDEEMAEQFANNGYALGCTKTPFESAKEGFLAGLKTGRQDKQLNKAIEVMKKLLHALKNEGSDYTFALESTHPVLAEAEQFLKGKNIILEDAQAGNSPFDADEVFNKEMKAYTDEKVK